MDVLFIYRSKLLNRYSVERCFDSVAECFSDEINVKIIYLPRTRADIFSIIENIRYVRSYIRDKKLDIVHITGDCHYIVLAIKDSPTILTIHDLRGLVNYKGIKRLIFKFLWLDVPVSRCNTIVAISNSTRSEIVDNIPQKTYKISVIPDPIDKGFVSKKRSLTY